MDPERQRERGVTRWLQMVRGLLRQAEELRTGRMHMFGISDEEVWWLTLRMERMKRDGTWARPIVDEHPRPELARVEGVQDAAEEEKNRTDALDIFPEEIWRKILESVTDEDEIWKCDRTCRLFETIFRPWKSGWNFEQALPYIYRHLSKDEILRCRRICKSWRDAIDHYLENHPSLRPHQEEEGYYMRLDFVCPLKEKKLHRENEFRFCNGNRDNSAKLDGERFQRRGQNPFIGRFVTVKLGYQGFYGTRTPDQPWDPWFDRFVQFWNTHGKEIWHLNLTLPNLSNVLVQDKLASLIGGFLLQSMPYLRKLTIDARGETYNHVLLQAELPYAPFLETLEVLNLEGMGINHVFYSLVEKYGPQLGKLHINSSNFMLLSCINFSNLKELTLQVGRSRHVSIFNQLNVLYDCQMPYLSKIQLIFPVDPRVYLLEDLNSFINSLMSTTNLNTLRLSGNLEGFIIASDRELNGRMLYDCRYNPSPTSLRSLEFDVDWMKFPKGCLPISYDFIQFCFPNLENLAVFARETIPTLCSSQVNSGMEVDLLEQARWEHRAGIVWATIRRRNDVLQLHRRMYGGNMYECRVWELLTELKVLTVQWQVFTREDYEYYHRI